MTGLLVVLGAAVGAPLRYVIDQYVRGRFGERLPWGTLVVNVAGSGVLGLLAGLPTAPGRFALLGTGFCGALTTYSTFGYETLRLLDDRRSGAALVNVAGSVLAGLGAAGCGLLVARGIVG